MPGDRRGAAGLMFALSLTMLLGFLALAVDFGAAALTRSQLGLAADAAALKAVTAASSAYAANASSNYLAAGRIAGRAFFNAQLGPLAFGTAATPTVTVTGSNGTFNATVTVKAVVPSLFGEVLGFANLNVTASSSASLSDPKYVAIQIMVDISGSMAILTDSVNSPQSLLTDIYSYLHAQYGSTAPSGGNTLVMLAARGGLLTLNNYQMTPTNLGQCAFACHNDTSTSGPGGRSDDYYGVAQANGLQMRIDVVRSSVQSIIQTAENSPASSYFQFGLYEFSSSLTTVFALGSNLSAAYAAAGNINVAASPPYCAESGSPPLCGDSTTAANGPNDANFRLGQVPNTRFEYSAGQLLANTLTPTPTSNGASASTPLRYLFIITDGVDDYTTSTTLNTSCCNQFIYAFNASDGTDGGAAPSPNVCDQIKAAGVTILVLYTPYTAVVADTYTDYVQPIVTPTASSTVTTALQACASPGGNYFVANNDSEIPTAMAEMLAIASGKVGNLTH